MVRGSHHTPGANLKNRMAHLGKKASLQTRALLSRQRVGHPGYMLGKKQTTKAKARISAANKISMLGNCNGRSHKGRLAPWSQGSLNPGWIDGRSALTKDGRPVKAWKRAVHLRDKNVCQSCKKTNLFGRDCHADHIIPWFEAPSLRFDVANGQTLCRSCHEQRTAKQNRIRMRNRRRAA